MFRAPEKLDYQLLEAPFSVDCIAVAALRSPTLKTTKNGLDYSIEDKLLMEKKIETILSLGILTKA